MVSLPYIFATPGCQFTAVFIGTCEATDEKGIPKNPTKTIINRYVFNTALTRARYLVVAVGNPLQLLEKEERMCDLLPENRNYQCWKEYIKRCLECKSFHLPKGVEKEQVEKFTKTLYDRVFSSTDAYASGSTSHSNAKPKDSILSAYKKKFESIPECRQSKLRLSRVKGGGLTWNMKEALATEQSETKDECQDEDSADIYTCRLNVRQYNSAEAIPLDTRKQIVQIRGMGNRRGAFHEDIVQVSVFNQLPEGKCYGKVVKVMKECHKQNLVCRAHKYNPILFCPENKKYPIITNLPKLSRSLMERRDKRGIVAELQSKDVVVFEPSSLSDGDIPQIKNVISHNIAQDMLFVVRIILWNPKFRLPLGVVVHALPKGSSAFHAERILMIEHEVSFDDQKDEIIPQAAQIEASESTTESEVDTRAFTIDPEDAVNLDDAISLTQKPNCYQFAVHIVNTTKDIVIGSEIDKKAAAHGVSVYGMKRVMNMLPVAVRSKLSLQPHQIREVMTVIGNIHLQEDKLEVKDIQVKETKVKSCAKLSYKSCQCIMDGNIGTSKYLEIAQCAREYDKDQEQPCLKDTLNILFQIAMRLRIHRLGNLAALSYNMDDQGEQDCWKAHLMVEEMMIWANNAIASKIVLAIPECALLRRQNAPNVEESAAFSSLHARVLGHSHSLSRCVQIPSPPQRPFVLTMSTLQLLSDALKAKDINLLLHLLTTDSLYPQLSVSILQSRRIQQKAEYCSTMADEDPSTYCHHSLHLERYTHFTSPLRRYVDIVVQRMIKSVITGVKCSYSHEDVDSMCHSLNAATRNAKSFEKDLKSLNLALQYTQSSELYEAFITKSTPFEIEICFLNTELKNVQARQKRFNVRHLKCRPLRDGQDGQTQPNKGNAAVYTWKLKLVSVGNPSFPYDYEGVTLVVPDTEANADFSTAVCVPNISMKLYRTLDTGMLKSVRYNVETPPNAVALSPPDWTKFMSFVQSTSKDSCTELDGILNTVVTPTRRPAGIQNQIRSPVVMCDVTCRMDMYDVVRVWMTWSTREAILSPQLQLIEIAPLFRICLQHTAHPAECFSDPNLKNASKTQYADMKEYVKLWEKVLLAEAAERSVGDSQINILFDVKLEWPKVTIPSMIDETHYEPTGEIKLVFPEDIAKPFFMVHVGDLMCIRYGTQKNSDARAVFHMVVVAKKPIEGSSDTTYLLKVIGRDNCRISEKMKPLLVNDCEIQVTTMSPSYQ